MKGLKGNSEEIINYGMIQGGLTCTYYYCFVMVLVHMPLRIAVGIAIKPKQEYISDSMSLYYNHWILDGLAVVRL